MSCKETDKRAKQSPPSPPRCTLGVAGSQAPSLPGRSPHQALPCLYTWSHLGPGPGRDKQGLRDSGGLSPALLLQPQVTAGREERPFWVTWAHASPDGFLLPCRLSPQRCDSPWLGLLRPRKVLSARGSPEPRTTQLCRAYSPRDLAAAPPPSRVAPHCTSPYSELSSFAFRRLKIC